MAHPRARISRSRRRRGSVGAGSLVEEVPSPYDPHGVQPRIFHYEYFNYSRAAPERDQGPLNWTDPEPVPKGRGSGGSANMERGDVEQYQTRGLFPSN